MKLLIYTTENDINIYILPSNSTYINNATGQNIFSKEVSAKMQICEYPNY